MTRTFLTSLVAFALLLAACEPAATPPAATPHRPEALDLKWPAPGEAVDASPVLQWEAFPGATHYQVTVFDSDTTGVVLQQDTSQPLLPVSPPLPPGARYGWNVQAQDASHAVLAELFSAFVVKDVLALLEPAPGAVVEAQPTFRWAAYTGTAHYQVLVINSEAYPPEAVVDTHTTETAFTVADPLAAGGVYSLIVRALDAQGAVLAEANTEFAVQAAAEVTFDCAGTSGLPVEECQALVTLYAKTGGAAWVDSAGWLGGSTPCDWPGVTCTDGHVTNLNLYHRNLAGTIPPELAQLTQLRVLSLRHNALSGPIPPEFGALAHLIHLDLADNALTGSLPAELGQLAQLQMLDVRGNALSGPIPATLGNLTELGRLDLSANQFSGAIPPELGRLAALGSLRLARNQLTGPIPPELGQLPALYDLNLSYNALSGAVPEAVLALPNRALWGNQLDGTLPCDGVQPVAYAGVSFKCAAELGASVWPEVMPAILPQDGAPFWEQRPEHVRFTLAALPGAPWRDPMGIGLAAEAQVLIFPAADLAALDSVIAERIEAVRALLETQPAAIEGEVPLLPLNNSQQMLHAQVRYLDLAGGSGVRFVTQYSQNLTHVNNRELFYTFQGLTADGRYYVAAFFPISLPGLPDTAQMTAEEFEALLADFENYLAETAALLETSDAEAFAPNLAQLDHLMESFVVQ